MSACEASMSLLFYFSRGRLYLDVFLLFSKMSYKEKKITRSVEFSAKF